MGSDAGGPGTPTQGYGPGTEADDAHVPLGRARSKWLVVLSLLLVLSALLLPWWRVTNTVPTAETSEEYGLWTAKSGWANDWAVWVTAGSLLLAVPLLFVRVAGRSWLHEPRSWARDLVIAWALVFVAVASAWVWPVEGRFWGTERFMNEGGELHVTGEPAAGWWLAALALPCLAWAAWRSRMLLEDDA